MVQHGSFRMLIVWLIASGLLFGIGFIFGKLWPQDREINIKLANLIFIFEHSSLLGEFFPLFMADRSFRALLRDQINIFWAIELNENLATSLKMSIAQIRMFHELLLTEMDRILT